MSNISCDILYADDACPLLGVFAMQRSKKQRSKNKRQARLPVDESRLIIGNTYDTPPDYYYDVQFNCMDCGKAEVWTAEQQQWWYEEAGGYFLATAVRCRSCRGKERERKREARIQAGHEPVA